jgi:hypothetical protein
MNEGTDNKVKLRVNLIVGNKIYRKGETIDKAILPDSMRKREYYWRVDDEEPSRPIKPVEEERRVRLVRKNPIHRRSSDE